MANYSPRLRAVIREVYAGEASAAVQRSLDRATKAEAQLAAALGEIVALRERCAYLEGFDRWLQANFEILTAQNNALLTAATGLSWPRPNPLQSEGPASEGSLAVKTIFAGDSGDILAAAREVRDATEARRTQTSA